MTVPYSGRTMELEPREATALFALVAALAWALTRWV